MRKMLFIVRFLSTCLLVLLFCTIHVSGHGKQPDNAFGLSWVDSNDVYYRQWERALIYMAKEQPKSAVRVIDSIYNKERNNPQSVSKLKAQLFLLHIVLDTSDDDGITAMATVEQWTKEAVFPFKAIWQSRAAELLGTYFDNRSYEILNRTTLKLANGTTCNTWDAATFTKRISKLYNKSISDSAALREIPINQFAAVLMGDTATIHLRPTLYDFLVNRAIGYFEKDEIEITDASLHFYLNDTFAFASARAFAGHSFVTTDTAELKTLSIALYQQLLKFHVNDAQKDALIDADINRLEFALHQSRLENKTELYARALHRIANKYPANPLAALALYKAVAAEYGFTSINKEQYQYDFQDEYMIDFFWKANPKKIKPDYPALLKQLYVIMQQYPGTDGANRADVLSKIVTKRRLDFQTEEIVLPNEPSKILVSYRNVTKIYVRVIKLTQEEFYNSRLSKREMETSLNRATVLATTVALPGSEDNICHDAEVKIDALPIGSYCIVTSLSPDFVTKENILCYKYFTVSNLIYLQEEYGAQKNIKVVLNRKTGLPIPGVIVYFFGAHKGGIYTATTQKDGTFVLPIGENSQDRQGEFQLSISGDTITQDNHYYYYPAKAKDKIKTFLFTDRSLYRPGQTVFFKGIMTHIEKSEQQVNTLAHKKTTVTFSDANDEKVKSLDLVTNEYGSFSGSFVVPENGLHGSMNISNENGRINVSVEEYKRPKFSVQFEPIKDEIGLNEKVTIQGKAIAFAGNAIDGANVKCKISMEATWEAGENYKTKHEEISIDTIHTDKDGNFKITFNTTADPQIVTKYKPSYVYHIWADVTDQNGELHSAETVVATGYCSREFRGILPEHARPAEVDTLHIKTTCLNGEYVRGKMHIVIRKLKSPNQIYRKRLWTETPDQFTMDEATFRRYFPLDEYKDENDPNTWLPEATVFDSEVWSEEDGAVAIGKAVWRKNGWYTVEITSADKHGIPCSRKSNIQIWDEHNEGVLMEPIKVSTETLECQPGDMAQVHVVSGFNSFSVLQCVSDMSGKHTLSQITNSAAVPTWNKQIAESDRGGIRLDFLLVKDNRVYQASTAVRVPWRNKELQLKWATHRDKLAPGSKETWSVTLTGQKKDKVAAEMMATLYDASLDVFLPHEWRVPSVYAEKFGGIRWRHYSNVTKADNIVDDVDHFSIPEKPVYQRLFEIPEIEDIIDSVTIYYAAPAVIVKDEQVREDEAPPSGGLKKKLQANLKMGATSYAWSGTKMTTASAYSVAEDVFTGSMPTASSSNMENIHLRKNLQETAFFYPELHTDSAGNIRIDFTMPEALTEWKFMALAHTKSMATGILEGKVKTQKELMVQPGLPRFLRQGDNMTLTTKVANLSQKTLAGSASLQLVDAITLQPLNEQFKISAAVVNIRVEAGASTVAAWNINVPKDLYNPVLVRIAAGTNDFSDGEENMLPVVTNKVLITETLPLSINGNGSKKYQFTPLLTHDRTTLTDRGVTVEYTSNPVWNAVLALPYLMEFPHECAEQTFNRFYANIVGARIINKNPKIAEVFRKWKTDDTAALQSPLEKNQELKTALLQETPWVMEAQSETRQRHNIAKLFEAGRLKTSADMAMKKLADMQLRSGGFPWFRGGDGDRYITQYILTGLGRLKQQYSVEWPNGSVDMVEKALEYTDTKMMENYEQLLKTKDTGTALSLSNVVVQYLYMRSFYKDVALSKNHRTAFEFFNRQEAKYQTTFGATLRGMIALTAHRNGNKALAADIMKSLNETAKHTNDGMYWPAKYRSYEWQQAPVEEQAMMIACYNEITHDTASIDAMKLWLLKQKENRNWKTTTATADACFALLLTGSPVHNNEPVVNITMGSKTINSTQTKQQAGTGYFKVKYDAGTTQPEMSNVALNVTKNDHNTSFGSIYWQYFEQMDKVNFSATPLTVTKEFWVNNTQVAPGKSSFRIGDKVMVRLLLNVEKDMEYVQLKDLRPACFEPSDVLSGYNYQRGAGFYQTTLDMSTNYFFSYLPKGNYLLEYPVSVTHAGSFNSGISTIQCMYAPEFGGHSKGFNIEVKGQ